MASQIATYDKIVGEFELREGGEWSLGRMTQCFKVEGRERLSRDGPMLIVSWLGNSHVRTRVDDGPALDRGRPLSVRAFTRFFA